MHVAGGRTSPFPSFFRGEIGPSGDGDAPERPATDRRDLPGPRKARQRRVPGAGGAEKHEQNSAKLLEVEVA